MTAREARPASETTIGLAAGLAAFTLWGVLPLYYSRLAGVPAFEILSHRVFWSMPSLVLLAAVMAKRSEIVRLFQTPKALRVLALTTVLISLNWGLFIWSVMNGRILDASLGYFINPLLSVALGAALLGEKLRGAQKAAIALAGVAVLAELVALGRFPWISLVLSTSFAAYGYLRKTIDADAVSGHFVEIAFLAPVALGCIVFFEAGGSGHFIETPLNAALMIGAGPLTVAPLIFFTMGARRLKLSTIGLLQYLGPTLQFLIAVSLGEAFGVQRAITFGLIWTGLAIFSLDAWRVDRAQRLTASGPVAGAGAAEGAR